MEKKKKWKYVFLMFIVLAIIIFSFNYMYDPMAAAVTSKSLQKLDFEQIISPDYPIPFAIYLQGIDPDTLDQSQETLGPSGDQIYAIGVNSMGGLWVGQEVINDRSPLTAFSVCVGRHGSPSDSLYVGIMIGSLLDPPELYNLNNWDLVGEIKASILPKQDVLYWVTGDISSNPLQISAGQSFYIVVVSNDINTDDTLWVWGFGGNSNTYPPGANCWFSGQNWESAAWGDCIFRSYTTSDGDGNGVPPDISISIQSQVVTEIIGIVSLLGAFISGTKSLGWI